MFYIKKKLYLLFSKKISYKADYLLKTTYISKNYYDAINKFHRKIIFGIKRSRYCSLKKKSDFQLFLVIEKTWTVCNVSKTNYVVINYIKNQSH